MVDFIRIQNPPRGADGWGSGAFGASRGGRVHKGKDYVFSPGERVNAPFSGYILRIGYPYNDDPEYRLIELLDSTRSILCRMFYVEPAVNVNQRVNAGDEIGHAQDIAARYDVRMKNHVHVETIIDPEALFGLLEA